MNPSSRLRRSRILVAILSIVVLLTACSPTEPTVRQSAAVTPSGSPGTSPASSEAPGAAPTLPPMGLARWTDCGKGFLCSSIKVPRDYDDLTAGTLDLSLLKRPATDRTKRIGSLLVNPGGPGGSGNEFVRQSLDTVPQVRP